MTHDDHDHDHEHDSTEAPSEIELRVKALESLLVEKGLVDPAALDELVDTLQREQDPVRPVVIVTVGVTTDADPVALQAIAAATGGTSYIAEDPRDIPEVFVKALNSRTQRIGGE